MPKVSVIIPFNNVESYISECLDSVLNQTLKDIEVILINDASTDKSRDIAQNYAEKDGRIILLDITERKGQGFARNRAIETAKGEYIGFVDSDDFIESDMFELLYNRAKADDTDITMCQVREYDDINGNYITSDYYSLYPLGSFENTVFSAEDTKEQILDINVALWNKVYKREYLNKINEKFPEGFIYEDLPFFFGTYLPAKRINIVWKNLYSYRVNRKNSTMQQFNNKILDRLPMVSLTYEKLKEIPFLSGMKQKIQGWIINDLFHRYVLLKENYHKEFFFLMKKVFESLEIENINDPCWSKVYHFQGYLLVINNSFENFNQKVFNEYLDIHKVEDRLRSEMLSAGEIDRRFNLLYSDLDKSYKYTQSLVEGLEDKTKKEFENSVNYIDKINNRVTAAQEEVLNNISLQGINITQETDDKLSLVYDEISKNYKYTEELNNNTNNLLDSKLNTALENLKNETDEKITKVYDEITKTYKYTEKLNDNLEKQLKQGAVSLYSDIKDLSFVVQDNFVELNKEQDFIKEQNKKLIDEINNLTQKNTEHIAALKNEYQRHINSKMQDFTQLLKQAEAEINNYLDDIKQQAAIERENNRQALETLKSEFKNILQEQQQRHEEEIINLKNQMIKMEADLKEEMKSPFKKFIEKYHSKPEK